MGKLYKLSKLLVYDITFRLMVQFIDFLWHRLKYKQREDEDEARRSRTTIFFHIKRKAR